MPNHVVQAGDCLSSIAAQQGLTWQQLWDHSNNADLRQQRQDPNILHPGDVVFVPDREERRHDGSTTRRHRFNRSDIPARLRIRLLRGGSAIKQAAYELFIDDQRVQAGQTDDEGRVEARISPAARAGVLRLTEARREFHLELGALDPVNETSGIQARLYNLGFDPGPIDGIIGPLTRAAVRSFQETYSLEVDGIPGPITQGKLQDLHGC